MALATDPAWLTDRRACTTVRPRPALRARTRLSPSSFARSGALGVAPVATVALLGTDLQSWCNPCAPCTLRATQEGIGSPIQNPGDCEQVL